jgi:hypothetical protein
VRHLFLSTQEKPETAGKRHFREIFSGPRFIFDAVERLR